MSPFDLSVRVFDLNSERQPTAPNKEADGTASMACFVRECFYKNYFPWSSRSDMICLLPPVSIRCEKDYPDIWQQLAESWSSHLVKKKWIGLSQEQKWASEMVDLQKKYIWELELRKRLPESVISAPNVEPEFIWKKFA